MTYQSDIQNIIDDVLNQLTRDKYLKKQVLHFYVLSNGDCLVRIRLWNIRPPDLSKSDMPGDDEDIWYHNPVVERIYRFVQKGDKQGLNYIWGSAKLPLDFLVEIEEGKEKVRLLWQEKLYLTNDTYFD